MIPVKNNSKPVSSFLHKVRCQPRKSRKSWKSWLAGGGELLTLFFLRQVSRHGVGVSSYITNLYNKHARKKKNHIQKGGAVAPNAPPPPFGRAWT